MPEDDGTTAADRSEVNAKKDDSKANTKSSKIDKGGKVQVKADAPKESRPRPGGLLQTSSTPCRRETMRGVTLAI